jgi:mycothiol system anti-sigma-R factor
MPHDDACASFFEDGSAFLDGELAAERAAELRVHLESCADCAARLDALRGVDRALAALPARSAPPDLRARLQARLDAGSGALSGPARDLRVRRIPAPRRRGLRASAAALAAAAALGAALALYLTTGAGVTPTPDRPPEAPSLAAAPAVDRDLDAASAEELAVASELDAIEDLGVIANLELLEMLVAVDDGGTG